MAQMKEYTNIPAKDVCLPLLSGWSVSLWTKELSIQFLVRAQVWVGSLVSIRGHDRGKLTLMFLLLSFSLPPHHLNINKHYLKNELNSKHVADHSVHSSNTVSLLTG